MIDWPALMPAVAKALLGEPNPRLNNAREWRYGTHGSLAVHVGGKRSGTWRDHETDEGGGVLDLVKREAGACGNREAMAWLRERGFLDGEPGRQARHDAEPPRRVHESRSEPVSGPDDGDDARRKVARRVWESTKPLAGTLAETYLHARGVGHVASALTLRFHPALRHRDHPSGMRFPTLVADIQSAGGLFLGLQRTYLDREGAPDKANVEPVKASLGTPAGGAVRLAEPKHGRLLVGEGIETTAAAMLIFDLPGWASLGTSGLRAIELPEHVHDVVIAADRDANGAGQLAAADLAARLEAEGRRFEIQLPPFVGDWNDVLLLARDVV